MTATLTTGCDKVSKGIEAYYLRQYAAAKRLLAPVAREAAKKSPKFKFKLKDGADLEGRIERTLYDETYVYFAAWQAYTGSLAGLGENEAACEQLQIALRPIEVKVKVRRGPDQTFTRDPRDSNYNWSAEVGAMQSLSHDLDCDEDSSESVPQTLL